MQNQDLDKITQKYIRKLSFVKGIIISEIQEGVEVFKYIADDLEFNTDKS